MLNTNQLKRFIAVSAVLISLSACGRKGALEAPPSDSTPRISAKPNTFFNSGAKIEKFRDENDIDFPLNPQLTAGGQVLSAKNKTTLNSSTAPGILPVGGGRKVKRILPPQQDFILDPLL